MRKHRGGSGKNGNRQNETNRILPSQCLAYSHIWSILIFPSPALLASNSGGDRAPRLWPQHITTSHGKAWKNRLMQMSCFPNPIQGGLFSGKLAAWAAVVVIGNSVFCHVHFSSAPAPLQLLWLHIMQLCFLCHQVR